MCGSVGSVAGSKLVRRSMMTLRTALAGIRLGPSVWRTGPHCMAMIGWWPSRRRGVAVRPVT